VLSEPVRRQSKLPATLVEQASNSSARQGQKPSIDKEIDFHNRRGELG